MEDENIVRTNDGDAQNYQRATPTKVALCNWCVDPGINQCEGCEGKLPKGLLGHLMCLRCDTFLIHCRLCRLEKQLEKNKGRVTPHRRKIGDVLGENTCFTCGEQSSSLKHCTGCGVAKYCDTECQREGYLEHIPYCNIFRQRQPLQIVYPWSMKRAARATRDLPHLFTNARNY